MKFGLIPEFVGRLPVLATLEDLDEPALIQILTEPKNALVKQYQRLFEMENVDLTFHENALVAIAKRAIDRKTGARGLRSIMEAILLDTMFELPALEGVQEVVISEEVVSGNARPLYIYAEPRRTRKAPSAPDSRRPLRRVSSDTISAFDSSTASAAIAACLQSAQKSPLSGHSPDAFSPDLHHNGG